MKILVCDDNKVICNDISKYIESNFDYNVSVANDKNSIYHYLNEDKLDLLIIDIVLGKINGIDIAKEFTKQFPNLNVIFITGYGNTYYKDIYKYINPCGFLEKPIQYNILNFFIKQIQDNFNARNSKLRINYNYNSYIIPYWDIIYIQSDKRLSVIHTTAEKFKTYKKLSDMLEELPDTFIRCHQSFIVNRDYVRNVEGNQFLLSSGNVIPISKKYLKNVKDLFLLNYRG